MTETFVYTLCVLICAQLELQKTTNCLLRKQGHGTRTLLLDQCVVRSIALKTRTDFCKHLRINISDRNLSDLSRLVTSETTLRSLKSAHVDLLLLMALFWVIHLIQVVSPALNTYTKVDILLAFLIPFRAGQTNRPPLPLPVAPQVRSKNIYAPCVCACVCPLLT